ncbi:MAG: hypothetical protein MAG451_00625 [Anaerolineales bacterium]|nr:hypothetical protein [Anaerolineales bacterium]
MPSPFPGMDPYLEDPAIWSDLHQRLITYAADALQPDIRPRYHAHIGERVYVVHPPRNIYPDVVVTKRQPERAPAGHAPAATMEPDSPVTILLPPEVRREPFIEIVDTVHGGRVVTVIEILSPANKTAGEDHELYRRKQKEVLSSETNLVEIDLLREGVHTVAVPASHLIPHQPWRYLINISRAGLRGQAEVYPLTLRQRLPRIVIPLMSPDPDAVVDLQVVFDQCYANGAYADVIDYTAEPSTPLSPDDAAWADELLQKESLR